MKKFFALLIAALMVIAFIPTVALADGVSLTGGTNLQTYYNVSPMIAPSIEVTSSNDISGASIAITGMPADCSIGYSNIPLGITVTVRDDNKVVNLTGIASAADYQQALRNIYINTGATSATVTFDIAIGYENTLYNRLNQHFYEFVPAEGQGWIAARDAAAAKTLYGMQGYLATITSAEENHFVYSFCGGRAWLGGSDAAVEDEWCWVTGPEAGQKFWQATGAGVGTVEPGMYENWQSGEPNEYQPLGEDYLHIFGYDETTDPNILGQWNDFHVDNTSTQGYVIEWGGIPGDPVVDASETCSLTINATVHTVSFNSHGGSAVEPISSVPYGSTISEPSCTQAGYDLDGWYTTDAYNTQWNFSSSTVDGDMTLHAKWTARNDISYKVEHYLQDVEGEGYTLSDTDNLTGTTDATVNAVAKTYTGFTENTTHSQRIASGTVAADGSLILKLYYDREQYTVTFDKNTTETVTGLPSDQAVRYNGKATEPDEPSSDDFELVGWYKESSCTNEWVFNSDTVDTDTTLYAKWSQNRFMVTYDNNGGSGTASEKQLIGDTFTLHSGQGFSKDGFVIEGWNIDGTEYKLGALYTMPSNDVTAEAIWAEDVDNDGISDDDETAAGTDPDDEDNTPETGTVRITVLNSSGEAEAGLTCVLNSQPVTAVTDANGIAVFQNVALAPHTLSVRSSNTQLGTYSIDFSKGSENGTTISDSGSTDSIGGVTATVTSTFLTLDLTIKQSSDNQWAIDDSSHTEQVPNPTTGSSSFAWLWVCVAAVLAAGGALVMKHRATQK